MFQEYESEEHEAKATQLLAEIGKFVVAFENICASMRSCIHCAFRREGLRNQSLSQAVVHGQSAQPLRQLLGNVFCSLSDQDDDDRACVKSLLTRIEKLAQERNRYMHSQWFLNYDYENASDEFFAMTMKLNRKEHVGPTVTLDSVNVQQLAEQLREAKEIQVLLHRLGICLNQTEFKVSEMFNKSL